MGRPRARGGGASVVVLVLGGIASGLGVGMATLLMGVVVAALVASDELRRDARRGPNRRSAVTAPEPAVLERRPGCRDPDP